MNPEKDNSPRPIPTRCNFYIDGFNVYHDLKEKFGNVHNKLNYYEFFKFLLRGQPEARLNTVCYFTALNFQNRDDRLRRHRRYIKTLAEVYGIEIIMGEFMHPKGYGPVENLTDVNLASRFIFDACKESCEVMYLYSSDNDFRPAIRAALAVNKNLRVYVLSPASREKNKTTKRRNLIVSLTNELEIAGRGGMRRVTKPELKNYLFTNSPIEKAPRARPPCAPAANMRRKLTIRTIRLIFIFMEMTCKKISPGAKLAGSTIINYARRSAKKIGGARGEMVYFATPIRGQEAATQRYTNKAEAKEN